MPVLVDSNVILDIVNDDPKWADWSKAQVTKFHPVGLVINLVIYAELCTGAQSATEVGVPTPVSADDSARGISFLYPFPNRP